MNLEVKQCIQYYDSFVLALFVFKDTVTMGIKCLLLTLKLLYFFF